MTIYNIERKVQNQLKMLDNLNIDNVAKEKIRDFINDLVLQGLTEHRQYFYLDKLKVVAEILGPRFLNPSKEDIKQVVNNIMTKSYKGWTVQGYLTTLKKFYKWLNGNEEYPECVKWIKKLPDNKLNGKPETIITEEEYHRLIDACKNLRDKAMIALLWDSGMRIGELLTMKVSDWITDQYGAIAMIKGKTGSRRIRVIGNSIVYVNEWLQQEHSDKNNPDSPLFTLRNNTNGEIEYATFRKVLETAQKQAGINRRIHAHLFRHTTATRYAGTLTEQILESQMGWVHGSKMSNIYVHLSGRDTDREVLRANGIEMQGEKDRIKQQLPKRCKRCDKENPSDATFCIRCGMPFDETIALEYEQKIDTIENTLKSSNIIDPMVKNILVNAPESVKTKILESVLEGILKDQNILKKFVEELRGKDEKI